MRLGTRVRGSKSSDARLRKIRKAGGFVVEELEQRVLLSATLRSQIPNSISPASVPQTLLAPGNISATLSPTSTAPVSSSFRFVLNNATAGELTQISTVESASGGPTDAAIALYDSSGNLITLQDADPSGSIANESLSAALTSGQQYEVAFYAERISTTGAQPVTLNINPGPQSQGSGITLNPSFGTASLTTSSAPNAFTSSTSVRYFSVNFLDAGTSGSISLNAAGPDTSVDATLYQLPQFTLGGPGSTPTWAAVGSATTTPGGSGTIAVTPASGTDVTDGNYVLAVAPLNFVAAAEPLTITLSTGNLLSAPATNIATLVGPIAQSLTAIGTVGGTINGSIAGSAAKLYSVTAAVTGTINVDYAPAASKPLLSVYGPGGTSLIAVSSSTNVGADASASFPVTAGSTYYLLVGPDAQAGVNDTFTLTTSESYSPTPIAVTSTLGQTTGLNLAASAGASFFQLSTGTSSVLAMQIAPASGSNLVVQATVIGPSQPAQTFTAAGAGQPLQIALNQLGNPGPYDVMLTSTSGTGTATFKYVALSMPQQIAINQLPNVTMNLAQGGVTTAALATTTGILAGVQYYQPDLPAGSAASTYSLQTAGGASAVLLHYVQNGGVLQLAGSAQSNSSGSASVSDNAAGNVLHAIAALPVNFSGSGTVQLSVSGPLPSGIGLAFVPNALPNQPPPAQGFQSSLLLSGVALTTPQEIDLYSTQLPFNLTDTSTSLTFTPVDTGGPLHVTVSILNGSNVLIKSATNIAGQPLTIPLSGITPGESLRFEVTSVAGSNLGSGRYGLSMTVNTTDPRPFLVTEQSFLPFSNSPVAGNNYFPQNLTITQVPFGPTGAVGDFTTSTPYNPTNGTGSIQVFEFSDIPHDFSTRQGFQITTTDLDPTIDTNFALFYQNTSSSTPNTYIPLPGTSVNFDYYPGDRSSVDARIVDINFDNTPFLTLGEFAWITVPVYAVVMNEEGSQGHFNISATALAAPTPTLGPGTGVPANVMPFAPSSGLADLNPAAYQVTATLNNETFAIRAPVDVGNGESVLTVSGGAPGQTFSADISTPPHGIIPGQSVDVGTGTFNSSGTATIGLGNASIGLPIGPLSPGGFYNLAVGVTSGSFPAGGLTLSNLTIGRAAVSPIASSSPTNYPLANGFNAAISRIDPAPNGSFTDALGISGTSVTADFSVSTAGPVVIHMQFPSNAVNPTLGLYQSGEHATVINQFTTTYASDGILLDSQNAKDANGLFTINANLLPGTYFVVGASSTSYSFFNRGTCTFTGTLPAFQATVLTVNPTTGNNTVDEETTVNPNTGDSGGETDESSPFYDYRYNSNFYSFTAPANVSGQPVSVFILDTANNAPPSTEHGYGNVNLFLFRDVGGVFTNVGFSVWAIKNSSSPYQDGFTLTSTDTPTPGAVYYVGVDMNGYELPAYIGVSVPILTSGLPDYSTQPVTLAADSGKTRVTSSIINESYTAAGPSTYLLQQGSVSSSRLLFPLAPFAAYPISFDWTPQALTDAVTVTADQNNTVAELSETNNTQSTPLSSVDHFTPTAQIELADANMSGESPAGFTSGGGTWGRYISGVSGQRTGILMQATDGGGTGLYEVTLVGPPNANSPAIFYGNNIYTSPTSSAALIFDIDFGSLAATSASNPNLIKFTAIDAFGLGAPTSPQALDVINPPSYLTGGIPLAGNTGAGGSITFSPSNYQFTYSFQDAIISYNAELNTLLGVQAPGIGTDPVTFLVAIDANGTGGLNPNEGVPLNVSAELSLSAFNDNLFDKHYTPADAQSAVSGSSITFNSNMILSGATLLPGSASVTLQIDKLQLFQIKSPKIPIFSLGIPDVIGVDAAIQFQFGLTLSAGVKLGTNPADATSATSYLDSLGVMSPTFIELSLSASATVSGNVQVAGLDVASLSGTVGAELDVIEGLDNSDPDAVFSPSDAFHNLAFDIDARFKIGLAASLPIIGNVWSYDWDHDLGNIVNTVSHGIFLTDPPSTASGKFIAPGQAPSLVPADVPPPTIVTITGSSPVGAYPIDPSPQIVIDNSVNNGKALSVQLVNVGTSSAPEANLSVSTRNSGVWSGMTTLSENNDVSDPRLALSHDGSGAPAVVAYQVDKVPGSPATQTVDQRFNSEEIAYRYYNGTSWGSESVLTSNSLYDYEPQVAFNSSGAGLLTFVHNTDGVPVDSNGNFDANADDVEVSVWNASTHSFGAPAVIGTAGDGTADTSPAAFVDASGNKYLVWLRGSGTSNQLMYSVSPAGSGTWSTPAQLPLAGLPVGGLFNNVALGSDGSGRIDVVFSYSVMNSDGTVSTTLFDRIATAAMFTSSQPVVQLASNSNFSGLHTTAAPGGAMAVYWQQSNGQTDQIEEATVLNGVETGPTQLSDDPNLATSPSLAVDGSGTVQVLYDDKIPYGGTSQGTTSDPQVGAPLTAGVFSSSVQNLPQLTFTSGLSFPLEAGGVAVSGSSVTGTAVVANRGLVAASVTITAFDGVPGTTGATVVGTPTTINLQPGASYTFSQLFTVLAGTNSYSVQLTTTGSQAFDTTENTSTTSLSGLVDVVAVSLGAGVQSPPPGTAQTLTGLIQNASNLAAGPFTVTLYQGDPLSPQLGATVLATQNVTALAAGARDLLQFPVTIPAGAGDDVYTMVVDSGGALNESNENNNEARYELDYRADPAITSVPGAAGGSVTATLLNSGNSNNVQVTVNVSNLGVGTLVNVPVDLQVSRNGGPLTSLGQMIIPTLASGASVQEVFTVTALAGDDLFVASIDSSAFAQDLNPSNDIGTAELTVVGLPTLTATLAMSSPGSVPGSPLTLNATVINSGIGDATSVPLVVLASLKSGGPSFTIGSGTVSVTGLSSQLAQIALNTTGLAPGLYTITLEIDPNQTIVQGSDAGNVVTTSEVLLVPSSDVINGTPNIDGITLFQDPDGVHADWILNGSSGGQLAITDPAGLTINGNGSNDVITLQSGPGSPLPATLHLNGTFTVSGLQGANLLANTKMDIGRSTVYVNYTGSADPLAQIRKALATGYNNGLWNGVATASSGAIVSSMASPAIGIAYIDSADGTGINPQASTIELRYAGYGDANLDGTTSLADFLAVSRNFGKAGTSWDTGDFNYDGSTSLLDLLALVRNFGKSVAYVPPATPTIAPSPTDSADPRPRLATRRTLAQTIVG